MPKQTKLSWARDSQSGAGAAGFFDAPLSFSKPFVSLDVGYYDPMNLEKSLDTFCGIVLHEIGHILYTRSLYHRIASPISDEERIALNIWDDERVESTILETARGFAGYIQRAKRVVLEEGSAGQAILRDWSSLPDLEKARALMFGFARIPHRLNDEVRRWTAVNGECVFETLRDLIPNWPETEAKVSECAERYVRLYERLRKLYPRTPYEMKVAVRMANGIVSWPLVHQFAADQTDHILKRDPPEQKSTFDLLLDDEIGRKISGRSLARVKPSIRRRSAECPCLPGRFGTPEALRATGSRVIQGLSEAEAEELERRTTTTAVRHFNSKCIGLDCESEIEVETVFVASSADEQRYSESVSAVRSETRALRSILLRQTRSETIVRRGLTRGKLDRRKIAIAPLSNRIYLGVETREKPSVDIRLLLDESGSMSGDKAQAARNVAVLFAEASRGINEIHFEALSHTSRERHCLIRKFSARNGGHRTLGNYATNGMHMNFDGLAIAYLTQEMRRTKSHGDRWLIVVSDGEPVPWTPQMLCAIAATRETVTSARRQGIGVIGVAIGDNACGDIYGSEHTLVFTDFKNFIESMKDLFVRICCRA